jgi:Cu(I)/Ag(I) efflux system membrane fusion protein
MKQFWINNFTMAIMVGMLFIACHKQTHTTNDQYICPMHPTVITAKPSTCPVCGMDLVRKLQVEDQVALTPEIAQALQSPAAFVIGHLPTVKPTYQIGDEAIMLEGKVVLDPNDVYSISSRIAGRVEYAAITQPYQFITAGQILMKLYSPEMVVAQRELLMVLDQDDAQLIEAAKNKLIILGANQKDIDRVMKTRIVEDNFAIYAPQQGYVITPDKSTVVTSSKDEKMAMEEMNISTPNISKESTLLDLPRVGDLIRMGDVLYTLAKSNRKRAEFFVLSSDVAQMHVGDTLLVDEPTNLKISVTELIPFSSEEGSYFMVRAHLPKDYPKYVGDILKAKWTASTKGTFWLPKSAVFYTGNHHVVWLKEGDGFKAKVVIVGKQIDENIQIIFGLSSADEVAQQAHFLVDSESFIEI